MHVDRPVVRHFNSVKYLVMHRVCSISPISVVTSPMSVVLSDDGPVFEDPVCRIYRHAVRHAPFLYFDLTDFNCTAYAAAQNVYITFEYICTNTS